MLKRTDEGFTLVLCIIAIGIGITGWILPVLPITVCKTTNNLCPTYSMNFSPKQSGTTSNAQSLSHTIFYCTGMTSGPLTITTSRNIQISGIVDLTNLNQTGQIYNIQIVMNNVVPSTTFGAGRCGSTAGASITTVSIYAAYIGTTYLWTTAFNFAPSRIASTWYVWLDIIPLVTDCQANILGNTQISMLEIK